MGLGEKWCRWVSYCISTARIVVLVNGSLIERFKISRGLFGGFKVGQGEYAMSVSHLQFVDDLIILFALPQSPVEFFSIWFENRSNNSEGWIWKCIPTATIWSICLFRNDMIFNGKKMDIVQLCFVIKTCIGWWVKARFPLIQLLLDELIANINTVDERIKFSPWHVKQLAWSPSPSGWLKFNVDGSMKADGSMGDIGGVLKDEYKHTLMTFSLNIGSGPAIMAGILALKFGFRPFLSSPWVDRFKLVIECDCRVAIEWVKSPSLAPDCFKVWVKYLHKALVEGGLCIKYILRQCNIEVDSLGKIGVVGSTLAPFVV
ncbi:hypothetical protein V6N11_050972 [Hibiscus sabdariffa]|uniref:RNase H type-1 domain-containing protein n=1 Tax=Hibiscus sabdariffa TaxID=183260 RepID=A0ABR2R2G9_9ROSI